MPSLTYTNEEEWLALRDMHIGGSDIASLFNIWRPEPGSADELILHIYEAPPEGAEFVRCLSPYTSSYRIWHEKAGLLKPSFQETERVQAGKFLEPALAAWAMAKWGDDFKLRKTRRYIRHDEVPGWGASFDYELVTEGYPPVEFKNVDWLIFRDRWGADGDGDITPPFHVNLQLQTQIGLTKADHGWIVPCVGGNELKRVRIERHEPTIDRIRVAIELFWEGVARKAVPTWLADFDTVKGMLREGVKDKGVDLTADVLARLDAARYTRWHRHAKYIAGHLDMMKARIAIKMGEATRAQLDGFTVAWPVARRAAKMQPAKWVEEATWRMGFTVKGSDNGG